MKTLGILILVCINVSSFAHAKAQVKTDSVYTVIRELVAPTTKITRTAKLNSAAEFHAKYLIAGKKIGHYEEDCPSTKTPMNRAEKFGDKGLVMGEVCWAGDPIYPGIPSSTKAAIYYFKTSDKHWDIMTNFVSQFTEIRFGYSRIETKDWSVCVIIYSAGPEDK
jgi:uncharacterized protein YkwD